MAYFPPAICCQKHKAPQEQRLKEMSKSNFQTMNKIKLYVWLKNKNIITKNKKMKCARLMWKHISIILIYANMNMKITWQGYGVRLCLKMVLNKLKEMKGSISIYTHLGTLLKEASKEASMWASSKKTFW
jgi:hypothetical protein